MKKLSFIIFTIFLFCFFTSVSAKEYYGVANTIANIRSGAGTGYKTLQQTSSGNTYDLVQLDKIPDEAGCSNGWYVVNLNGTKGYVCSLYLDVYEKSANNDTGVPSNACELEMQVKGFPSSYWGSLCSLKSSHENWNFVPVITNVEFVVAVNAESSCGTNLMSTSVGYYINSNCNTTNYNGYRTISSGVVAFYLDPRNFLNETQVFMFEDQYYNKDISDDAYKKAVVEVLGSRNYMLSQIPDLPSFILNAGKQTGMSPIGIASRMKQEMGQGKLTSGSYSGQLFSSISGNYYDRYGMYNNKNFNNYYNFFNIGAYDSCSGITECALTYAFNKGWGGSSYNQYNGRQVAINGGTDFIKSKYIDRGQESAYLQKFNVNPKDGYNRYTNQYMTNVEAPSGEGSLIYSAYKEVGLVNSGHTFRIPVFKGMPIKVSLPTSDADKEYNASGPKPDEPSVPEKPDTGVEEKLEVNQIVSAAGFRRKGEYITNFAPGKSVEDVINSLQALKAKVTVKNGSGKVVTNGKIATSFKITIEAKNTETLTVILYGDVSGDGNINALDLLKVQKSILGSATLNNVEKEAADPSKDGKVNALDLLKVQKHILGSETIVQ